MRPFRRLAQMLALVLAALAPPAAARAEGVTVFAAASLKTALDEIAAGWTAATGVPVTLSYAGTSALARQIALGAPADIFISASPDWMDRLAADGRIDPATRADLVANRLVLVRHGPGADPVEIGPAFDLPARLGEGRLAMALVDAVPAGIYGKAALAALGLWETVAPRVAQADNVRAALALVALGEARYGIVYATDAAAEARVSVAATFPAALHPPIVYPAAAVAGRRNAAADAFLAHLSGAEARPSFARQGFLPAGE